MAMDKVFRFAQDLFAVRQSQMSNEDWSNPEAINELYEACLLEAGIEFDADAMLAEEDSYD